MYNDGTRIEQEKFDQTRGELADQFTGLAQELVHLDGLWQFAGKHYEDRLIRIRIDSGSRGGTTFLRSYKEILKSRFQQLDIWITAHEIEII
jgi:hypothetical protein